LEGLLGTLLLSHGLHGRIALCNRDLATLILCAARHRRWNCPLVPVLLSRGASAAAIFRADLPDQPSA